MFESAEKNGLRFKCTQCGECCRGSPGYVWLSRLDIIAIARFLDISDEKFLTTYCLPVSTQHGTAYSLKEKKDFACIFLKEHSCAIYSVRPLQCRTYPFWDDILKDEQSWKDEARWCPGINGAAHVAPETIQDAIVQSRLNPVWIKDKDESSEL